MSKNYVFQSVFSSTASLNIVNISLCSSNTALTDSRNVAIIHNLQGFGGLTLFSPKNTLRLVLWPLTWKRRPVRSRGRSSKANSKLESRLKNLSGIQMDFLNNLLSQYFVLIICINSYNDTMYVIHWNLQSVTLYLVQT